MHNTVLDTLELQGNPIGDAGAVHLAAMLKANHSLTQLVLWQCDIGDEGGVALSMALSENNDLLALFVHRNAISERIREEIQLKTDIASDSLREFHVAIMVGNLERCRLSVASGINLYAAVPGDDTGNTAIHLLALQGDANMLIELQRHSKGKLRTDVMNARGKTPLEIARKRSDHAVVEVLTEYTDPGDEADAPSPAADSASASAQFAPVLQPRQVRPAPREPADVSVDGEDTVLERPNLV